MKRQVAAMTLADEMVRDCCELSEADPAHPDTLCISVNELTGVVERFLERAQAANAQLREACRRLIENDDAAQICGDCTFETHCDRHEDRHWALHGRIRSALDGRSVR